MDITLRQTIVANWYLGSLIMGVESGDTQLAGWTNTISPNRMTNADKFHALWHLYGSDPRGNHKGLKGLLWFYAIQKKLADPNWNQDPYLALFGTKVPSQTERNTAMRLFRKHSKEQMKREME